MAIDITLPVQRQLEADNARDVDALMRCWADDGRLHAFPDQLLAEGADAIRAHHAARWLESDLHRRLVRRTVIGDLVVDREAVTRRLPQGPGEMDVLGIYEVPHDRIVRAWFKTGEPKTAAAERRLIRRATEADADAARTLTRAAYAKWVPVIGREPRPMGVDYAEAVRANRIDLFYDGNELSGLIELVPGETSLLIRSIAVAPGHQGRGLGRRMLDHADAVARELGLPSVTLYTNAQMVENLQLYLAYGYTIDHTTQSEWGTAVHMSKAAGIPGSTT